MILFGPECREVEVGFAMIKIFVMVTELLHHLVVLVMHLNKGNSEYWFTKHQNVAMNSLQERESRILGVVAPSFSTIWIIWGGKGERDFRSVVQNSMSREKVLTAKMIRH